jgi:hypothetical protein
LGLLAYIPRIAPYYKFYPKAPFAVVLNDKVDEEIFHKDRKIYFISFKNIDFLEELLNS